MRCEGCADAPLLTELSPCDCLLDGRKKRLLPVSAIECHVLQQLQHVYTSWGYWSICMLKDVIETISITSRIENLVAYVSSRVFGVYLVHLLVLNILDSIGFSSLMYNSAIVIPALSVVIFAISFAVLALFGCIPMFRRWIV